jgi:hypothetical protein
MPTLSQPYFLDGGTLLDSTTVYLNSGLSIPAPDGYYSDGFNIRRQIGGVLEPSQPCPACGVLCGGQINGSGNQGEYLLEIDTGTLPTAVGAIIVTFNPLSIPDGIIAELDGVYYNELSSPVYGYLAGTPGLATFLGTTGADCGISGSTYTLNVRQWNGTAFVPTGTTDTITVAPGQMQLTTNAPGACIMVIPKTNATPSLLTVRCYGVCGSTAFNVNIKCPAKIKSINSSVRFTDPDNPALCSAGLTSKLYPIRVTGVSPYLGLHDWIFADEFASAVVADGFYRTNNLNAPYDTIEVANGVVVALLDQCP